MFRFLSLLLLYFLMEIRRTSFRGVVENLSAEDCSAVGLPMKDGMHVRPSAATLNGFVNRWLPMMFDDAGEEIAVAVLRCMKRAKRLIVTMDSTPLEASKSNRFTDFNTHYKIKMDKCHIIMVNGFPLFMVQSSGNAGDNPFAEELIRKLDTLLAKANVPRKNIDVYADGAYDSVLTHAHVYIVTGAVMKCTHRCTAVFSGVNRDVITAEYGKLWKVNGFRPEKKSDVDFMLRFIYRHGDKETVGSYIRNLSMKDETEQKMSGVKDTSRQVCETVHNGMKQWLDFTVRRLRNSTKHDRIRCRFLCIQFLMTIFEEYTVPS